MEAPPRGTVTLLFSDIEGSTKLLARLGDRYVEVLATHRAVLRNAWDEWGGREMGTDGDGFFVAFEIASHAANAAIQAQRDLAAQPWPEGERLRVRFGFHTGEPAVHDGGYVGMDVHRAARVASAAHGGQVVLTEVTQRLLAERLADDVVLDDLGWHRFKDLPAPEHIYQLSAAGLPRQFPTLKSLGALSNLPAQSTPMVGREDDVDNLRQVLRDDGARLTTLTGPGGVGKTRLAVEVASGLAASFADGIYFVPFASVSTAAGMWTTLADSLASGSADADAGADAVVADLAHRRLLLVLDNLEQLPSASTVLQTLLERCTALAVIATSRRALRLREEHEYAVQPLDLPPDPGLDSAALSEAVMLFVQQARKVRPDFELTEDNVAAVAEICARLDGLPLGIELAAGRSRLLTPAALLSRLDTALGISGREVDRPERHQTLRSTIAWSHDLLDPELQRVFRRLGVLKDGGDLDAVAAIVGTRSDEDPLDAIAELVDVNLVSIAGGVDDQPRVDMLGTVRAFALERLTQSDDVEACKKRHARYFADLIEGLLPLLDLVGQHPVTRDRLESELPNVREALRWAAESGGDGWEPERVQVGLRLAAGLSMYSRRARRQPDVQGWLEQLVALAGDVDTPELASALMELSAQLGPDGDRSAMLRRALAMYEALGDRHGTADALVLVAMESAINGDHETARRSFERSIALATDIGDDMVLAAAYQWYANMELRFGEPDRARELSAQSGMVGRRRADERAILSAEADIAWAFALAGRPEEALDLLDTLVDRVRRRDDDWITQDVLWAYSAVFAVLGDAERAARLQGFCDHNAAALLGRPTSPGDNELAERAYQHARDLISPQAWQAAERHGATLTAAQAFVVAQAPRRHRRTTVGDH